MSVNDIRNMPNKQLLELRDSRVESLIERQKALEEEAREKERESARQQILAP